MLTKEQNEKWNKMNLSYYTLERFWSKVIHPGNNDDCWEFIPDSGMFWLNKKFVSAAHFSYQSIIKILPSKAKISRICNNSKCVNPYHMILNIIDIDLTQFNKMNYSANIVNRFWAKVEISDNIPLSIYNLTDPCWNWIGSQDIYGYGQFIIGNKRIKSSHFSYEYFNGPIEKDLMICHKCNNPNCVNPNHLYQGTAKDNQQDCIKSGRQGDVKGSKHGMATTEEEFVKEFIQKTLNGEFVKVSEIEEQYNISRDVVYQILTRKSWTHITDSISDEDLLKVKILLNERRKILPAELKDIRIRIYNKESDASIARYYNVTSEVIRQIRLGNTYKNL